MKLIWHIIRKDVRQHRWALPVWALLFAAQIVLGLVAQRDDGAELETVISLQQVNVILVILQFATGYILVSRFVQADGLAGTRMFWLTRPISATRLLVAKALGVGLVFSVLPVLWLLPWWLYNGFGLRDILWAALETFGWQLLMVAPAFLLASLTDDLGRVLMWTLVIVTGLFAGIVILQSKLGVTLGDAYRSSRAGVLFTRLWLAGALLVAGTGAIAIHQFLTRRSPRSVGLTAALLGLVVLVGSMAWFDWSKWFDGTKLTASVPVPPGLVEGLTFSVGPAEEVPHPPRPDQREMDRELHVVLRVRGLPEDVRLLGDRIEQTWQWAGNSVFKRPSSTYYYYWRDKDVPMLRTALNLREHPEDPETVRWQQARFDKMNADLVAHGGKPVPRFAPNTPEPDWVSVRADTWLPASTLARMRVEPSVYTASVQGIISRPYLVAGLPLNSVGTRGFGESQTFRFLQDQEGKTALVATAPSVMKTGLWQSLMGKRSGQSDYLSRQRLLLVNRATGDIGWVGRDYSASPRSIQVGGVVIGWEALSFQPSRVVRGGQWVPHDAEWRDHSSLAIVTDRELVRFTREVTADMFKVKPSATDKPEDAGPDAPF